MRKLLYLMLAVVMVLCMSFAAFASDKPTITVDTVSGRRGDTVKVNINIKNNDGFAVVALFLNFDKNVLIPVSVDCGEITKGSELYSNFKSGQDFNEMDFISFVVISPNDFKGDGTLFSAEFKIEDSATTDSPLNLTYTKENNSNENYEVLDFDVVQGKINVTDALPPQSGDPSVQVPDQNMSEVDVNGAVKPVDPNAVTVMIDGKEIEFDQPPVIINSRTMVPMRAIFEAAGAEVSWDQDTKTATGERNGDTIKIQIDNAEMKKNNETIILDSPAKLINSRTLVPARAITEAFGYHVEWEEGKRLVSITTK